MIKKYRKKRNTFAYTHIYIRDLYVSCLEIIAFVLFSQNFSRSWKYLSQTYHRFLCIIILYPLRRIEKRRWATRSKRVDCSSRGRNASGEQMGEGGTREEVVQSVIDWKCKLAEGGTSTATTRQMAIGQRVRVSKFANRGNKFDFVLEIIKSPPRNLHSLQFHRWHLSMSAIPPTIILHISFSRIIKPRNHFYLSHRPIYRDS